MERKHVTIPESSCLIWVRMSFDQQVKPKILWDQGHGPARIQIQDETWVVPVVPVRTLYVGSYFVAINGPCSAKCLKFMHCASKLKWQTLDAFIAIAAQQVHQNASFLIVPVH